MTDSEVELPQVHAAEWEVLAQKSHSALWIPSAPTAALWNDS